MQKIKKNKEQKEKGKDHKAERMPSERRRRDAPYGIRPSPAKGEAWRLFAGLKPEGLNTVGFLIVQLFLQKV